MWTAVSCAKWFTYMNKTAVSVIGQGTYNQQKANHCTPYVSGSQGRHGRGRPEQLRKCRQGVWVVHDSRVLAHKTHDMGSSAIIWIYTDRDD
jgi:hypothetical protein